MRIGRASLVLCLAAAIASGLVGLAVYGGDGKEPRKMSSTSKPQDKQGTAAPASQPATQAAGLQKATFAAGCFWGVESTFRKVKGVTDAAVGYIGGATENPTYKLVCTGTTHHAEAVQVTYDPKIVSYEDLLTVFWKSHNPTTPNRQGPDFGEQYRSAIFYHTPEQAAAAKASKEKFQAGGKYKVPIVTQIVPAGTFWRAEEYHQRYFEKNGGPACHTP